ncbi:BON domain-containing protein [Phenylobacterium soli]|uniref:BON domain-containing protein n=1 Tax=Phenylobacterium soli TaxID=2170551 RepID=A0A328AFH4_9CAUL|nr:BON domain-containing protein [Phenylobacterium soli]RAK53371.1 hypothetical protein DJ017_01920 [Phenylobacterium soli]
MPDRRGEPAARDNDPKASDPGTEQSTAGQSHAGGYEGGDPGYGRGYGRDFGGAGRNQGFDGSWGAGYGGSVAPSDYREGFGGEAYGGGMSAGDYDRSFGGRGETFGADDRSWMDICADDEAAGRSHHRGRGPKDWNREDQQVYEAVCERLLRDPLLDARGMSVEVEEGVVTLSGEARHSSDPSLAKLLASEVAGVKAVRAELVIRPGPPEPPPPMVLNAFGIPMEPRYY